MRAVRVTEENYIVLGNLFFGAPFDKALLDDIFYFIEDENLDDGPFLMRKNAFDENYCFIQPGEVVGTFTPVHLTIDELLRRFEKSKLGED